MATGLLAETPDPARAQGLSGRAFVREPLAVALPSETPALAARANSALAADTIELVLFHSGLALNWELELLQRPVADGAVCRQRVVSWSIGPIKGVPLGERSPGSLVQTILASPAEHIQAAQQRERFRRKLETGACRGDISAGWVEAPDFATYVAARSTTDRLRRLYAAGRERQLNLDPGSLPDAEARSRIRDFLDAPLAEVARDGDHLILLSTTASILTVTPRGHRLWLDLRPYLPPLS